MNNWIKVTDRLPEIDYKGPEYTRYIKALVFCSAGVLCMDFKSNAFAKTEKGRAARWEYQGRISPWDVTHWMPMPDGPSEES